MLEPMNLDNRGGYPQDERSRLVYPDIVKGVAIILVVFGHCIQYGTGTYYLQKATYFLNPIFRFIYSFHMPLFMMVSGYFFAFSIKKYEVHTLILKRIRTLIIPVLVWSLIPVGVLVLKRILFYQIDCWIFPQILSTILQNLWFLWAILVCSFLTLIISSRFNDSFWIYASSLIIFMLFPDVLNTECYKFMFPYFVIGYFVNKENLIEKIKPSLIKRKYLVLVITVVIFGVLYCFYGYESYIYTSGIFICKGEDWTHQVGINVFRWIIGLIGAVMALWGIYIVIEDKTNIDNNVLTKIGKNSMGIYILSSFINKYILPKVTGRITDLNYMVTIIESVIILSLCYMATEEIKKQPLLNRLLLGGR